MSTATSFELSRLERSLAAAGLAARLRRGDPVDQLLVRLAPDRRGRQPDLELLFVSDLLQHLEAAVGRERPPAPEGEVDQLQLYVNLPFGVEPGAVAELSRLILLLNTGLPLMGLGLREADCAVYFRHLMMCEGFPLSDRLVVETVRLIERILDRYGEALEEVAAGRKDLAQALAED